MTDKNLSKKEITKDEVRPGMLVQVHQKIKDITAKGEEKERIQIFEGTVISRKGGKTTGATITVRKISEGVGVEKIFPLYSPIIAKIEFLKQYHTRRAKLYFLSRDQKRRRLKEK